MNEHRNLVLIEIQISLVIHVVTGSSPVQIIYYLFFMHFYAFLFFYNIIEIYVFCRNFRFKSDAKQKKYKKLNDLSRTRTCNHVNYQRFEWVLILNSYVHSGIIAQDI